MFEQGYQRGKQLGKVKVKILSKLSGSQNFSKVASPAFVHSSALFTGNLYKEALKYVDDNNLALTPLALEAILGLVRKGSQEDTAQEVKTALSFPPNPLEIENVIKTICPLLKKGRYYHYLSGNRIYMEKTFPIKKDFKTVNEDIFRTDLVHLDFLDSKQRTREINDFVQKVTEDQIKHIVDASSVDPNSKMVCVSATFFKLVWSKFQKDSAVSRRNFYLSPSKIVEVDFLEKNGYFNYYESSEFKVQVVQIPLENNLFVLTLVLPTENEGLSLVESHVVHLFQPLKYKEERVRLIIPRFRFECLLDLKKVFQRLGMKKAFCADGDLSGFIAEKQALYINHVLTKTVVSFNEDTSNVGNIKPVGSIKRFVVTYKPFTADHPFIAFIKVKDVIIFVARVMNPVFS